jgi:hypothetical protein
VREVGYHIRRHTFDLENFVNAISSFCSQSSIAPFVSYVAAWKLDVCALCHREHLDASLVVPSQRCHFLNQASVAPTYPQLPLYVSLVRGPTCMRYVIYIRDPFETKFRVCSRRDRQWLTLSHREAWAGEPSLATKQETTTQALVSN